MLHTKTSFLLKPKREQTFTPQCSLSQITDDTRNERPLDRRRLNMKQTCGIQERGNWISQRQNKIKEHIKKVIFYGVHYTPVHNDLNLISPTCPFERKTNPMSYTVVHGAYYAPHVTQNKRFFAMHITHQYTGIFALYRPRAHIKKPIQHLTRMRTIEGT